MIKIGSNQTALDVAFDQSGSLAGFPTVLDQLPVGVRVGFDQLPEPWQEIADIGQTWTPDIQGMELDLNVPVYNEYARQKAPYDSNLYALKTAYDYGNLMLQEVYGVRSLITVKPGEDLAGTTLKFTNISDGSPGSEPCEVVVSVENETKDITAGTYGVYCFDNNENVILVGSYERAFRSLDGDEWSNVALDSGRTMPSALYSKQYNYWFACINPDSTAQSSYIGRSVNNGASFTYMTATGISKGYKWNRIVHVDSATIVAVGTNGNHIRTSDGGASWSRGRLLISTALNGAAKLVDAYILVGQSLSGSDNVFYTTDFSSFTSHLLGGANTIYSDAASSGTSVIIVNTQGSIRRATQLNSTSTQWSLQTASLQPNLRRVKYFEETGQYVIVGQYSTLLVSNNDGETWTAINQDRDAPYYSDVVLIDGEYWCLREDRKIDIYKNDQLAISFDGSTIRLHAAAFGFDLDVFSSGSWNISEGAEYTVLDDKDYIVEQNTTSVNTGEWNFKNVLLSKE